MQSAATGPSGGTEMPPLNASKPFPVSTSLGNPVDSAKPVAMVYDTAKMHRGSMAPMSGSLPACKEQASNHGTLLVSKGVMNNARPIVVENGVFHVYDEKEDLTF